VGYCNFHKSIQKVRLIDERGEVLVMKGGGGVDLAWFSLSLAWGKFP